MFTALEAALNEVTPEDLWKGTKTVLLEVARETIGSVKSQTKKKWIPHDDGWWTAAVVVYRAACAAPRSVHCRRSSGIPCVTLVRLSHSGRRLLHFYRAMLGIRGTSHGPVSVRLSVCQSVRHKSEFY